MGWRVLQKLWKVLEKLLGTHTVIISIGILQKIEKFYIAFDFLATRAMDRQAHADKYLAYSGQESKSEPRALERMHLATRPRRN